MARVTEWVARLVPRPPGEEFVGVVRTWLTHYVGLAPAAANQFLERAVATGGEEVCE